MLAGLAGARPVHPILGHTVHRIGNVAPLHALISINLNASLKAIVASGFLLLKWLIFVQRNPE